MSTLSQQYETMSALATAFAANISGSMNNTHTLLTATGGVQIYQPAISPLPLVSLTLTREEAVWLIAELTRLVVTEVP